MPRLPPDLTLPPDLPSPWAVDTPAVPSPFEGASSPGAVANPRGGARSEAGAGAEGGVLPRPRFTFRAEGVSAPWHVLRFVWRERLSSPYEATVTLAADDPYADAEDLLGRSATLTVSRGELSHARHGVIDEVRTLGVRDRRALCEVRLVPALSLLAQRVDSAIWQDRTALEVVTEVLTRGLGPWRREHRASVQREPPTREYCVQYQESDLAFVSRLLAEEGLGYAFEHGEGREAVALFDLASGRPSVTLSEQRALEVRGPEDDTLGYESLRHVRTRRGLRPTRVTLRDHDWTRPALSLSPHDDDPGAVGSAREHYDAASELTLGDYLGRAYTADDGGVQATLRREALTRDARVLEGEGNVTGFTSGATFELSGMHRSSLDGRWLLTEVEHRGESPEKLAADVSLEGVGRDGRQLGDGYRNTFRAQPADVPWRPERTARRRVTGAQTATVVGPPGEELHTDVHGRVKLRFHWDRGEVPDARRSCWVRVATALAGGHWGTFYLPRVGMEVVVSFVEGNPDRPLVTGCVYNGQHAPPFALPEEAHRSGYRSASTPGSQGFNELRFDDAADREEVYLHAQRDLRAEVLRDERVTVERHEALRVKGQRYARVEGNETQRTGGRRAEVVEGDRTVRVKGNAWTLQGGDARRVVSGEDSLSADVVILEAATGLCLKGPGGFVVIDQEGVKIVGQLVKLNSGGAAVTSSHAGDAMETLTEGDREPEEG